MTAFCDHCRPQGTDNLYQVLF